MEKNKDLYEAFYRMENMVDIQFADYEEKMEKQEKEKERKEDDAIVPSLGEYSSSSYSSHDSNEEINQSLQAQNIELNRLLQEAEVAASIMSHRRGLGKVEV